MGPGRIARLLAPPLCPLCRGRADPRSALCGSCLRRLNLLEALRGDPPAGIDRIVSCGDHDGVARALLSAYKFRRMTGLAAVIAGYMADVAAPVGPGGLIVPVPPARLRTWLRGFDPVSRLAVAVAAELGAEMPPGPVLRRHGRGRQRGRSRSGRMADPPDIRPAEGAARHLGGRPVLVVDDVMTTGATLAATAAALRLAGAGPVGALTFTRRL